MFSSVTQAPMQITDNVRKALSQRRRPQLDEALFASHIDRGSAIGNAQFLIDVHQVCFHGCLRNEQRLG